MTNEIGSDARLRYYLDEMAYLRRMGGAFARRYPKVAERLQLSGEQSPDPQVERMIESFALLTARLEHQLDAEFPEITTALLGVLHPQLVEPVPPMAIARFDPDPAQGKITAGFAIPRGAKLFARAESGVTCRFRTCYPVTVWPLAVVEAAIESADRYQFLDRETRVAGLLRIRFSVAGSDAAELELDRLRLYLSAERATAAELYESLFAHLLGVVVLPPGNAPHWLPPGAVAPVGFSSGEDVLPRPPQVHPAYGLLQEYFLFLDKFHFFDVSGLRGRLSGATFDLLFLFDRLPKDRARVDQSAFTLGATPIVNLFPRTSEPIRIDQRRHEYRLVADQRRERTTEIHSILSVTSTANPAAAAEAVEPFYGFRHRSGNAAPRHFWHARRRMAEREDLPGTEILLSFVDLDFDPSLPPLETVYAHTLCTNRALAAELPAGARLEIEESAPLRISTLGSPTPALYPPLGGASLWRLISNLSLNNLSLGGEDGLEALRSILRLYSFSERPSTFQQMQGLRSMECRPITRRVGQDSWRGFCRGTAVELTLDESQFVGANAMLFGMVMERFLPLYASINSFTQLTLRSAQREGAWKSWPPRAGEEPLV
ncbi:MAG: type VI secretion system baseplate subunit TssF [Bryobacteraceae bacterium]|nr:type VI secretion system baseplate subunit TssF [Bryobacteraceae bacterium]